ncbi:MAG TPA: hypothetical protein VNK26_02580, partial [Pyrinomonadaceae bacterium]|nr:hypothetical protein [Pyrinomonadaceae bacterium]
MKSGSVDNALSHLTLSTDEAAFIFNEDWLHVITKKNFRMNRKSMLSLWQKIGTVCNDKKTRRVLLEFKGKQPSMETTDTYESAVRASQSVRNFRLAILADE